MDKENREFTPEDADAIGEYLENMGLTPDDLGFLLLQSLDKTVPEWRRNAAIRLLATLRDGEGIEQEEMEIDDKKVTLTKF